MPQSQEAYYHPHPPSATTMPYRYYERQPTNSMSYPVEGSSYGRSSLNVPELGYYQDYCQQHCYYQQNQPQQAYVRFLMVYSVLFVLTQKSSFSCFTLVSNSSSKTKNDEYPATIRCLIDAVGRYVLCVSKYSSSSSLL